MDEYALMEDEGAAEPPANDSDHDMPEDVDFNMGHLKQHLRESSLLESWGWTENPQEENGLLLFQVDRASRQLRLHVEIHPDLSVSVRHF